MNTVEIGLLKHQYAFVASNASNPAIIGGL